MYIYILHKNVYIFVWNVFIYICIYGYTHSYRYIYKSFFFAYALYLYLYKNNFFDSSFNTDCTLLSVDSHGQGIDGGAGLVVTLSLTCILISLSQFLPFECRSLFAYWDSAHCKQISAHPLFFTVHSWKLVGLISAGECTIFSPLVIRLLISVTWWHPALAIICQAWILPLCLQAAGQV